jgi:hypothetical protein
MQIYMIYMMKISGRAKERTVKEGTLQKMAGKR